MGIIRARDRLLAKLEIAGVSAITQDRLSLEQNGVYLVFSAVLTPKDRPFAYRFNLWIVSSDYQQTGGAFETIDSVLELWRRETREFGRADWTIGEAVLERIDGALSAFRIAITIF